jgi:POT family proton-dependent oligopeptide transporter
MVCGCGTLHYWKIKLPERFSFYGIQKIMTTFSGGQSNPTKDPALQAVAEAKSNELSHLFVTLADFMPLVGGYWQIGFWEEIWVILYVSMLYCGNLMVALNMEEFAIVFAGAHHHCCCSRRN